VIRVGSGQGHQSCLALGDLVVARATALGSVVPEAADGQQHQAWVQLAEAVQAEAEAIHDPWPEVFHEDVRPLDEPLEATASLVRLQVELDRLLVAVGGQEVCRDGVVVRSDERRTPVARLVADARRFHLDDAGSHVAEHHRGVRSGQGSAEVDDNGAGERPGRHGRGHGRRRGCTCRSSGEANGSVVELALAGVSGWFTALLSVGPVVPGLVRWWADDRVDVSGGVRTVALRPQWS